YPIWAAPARAATLLGAIFSACWKAARACLRSPLPARAMPCKVHNCALPGEAFSAERVSSTALSNCPALSAEAIGAVGSSWDWERATEWQANRAASRPSFLRRATGIPRRLEDLRAHDTSAETTAANRSARGLTGRHDPIDRSAWRNGRP